MAKMDYGKNSPYKLSKERRDYANKGIGKAVKEGQSADIKSAGEACDGEYGKHIKMKPMPKNNLF